MIFGTKTNKWCCRITRFCITPCFLTREKQKLLQKNKNKNISN